MTLREDIEVVGKALGPEGCSVRSRAAPLGLGQHPWAAGTPGTRWFLQNWGEGLALFWESNRSETRRRM